VSNISNKVSENTLANALVTESMSYTTPSTPSCEDGSIFVTGEALKGRGGGMRVLPFETTR